VATAVAMLCILREDFWIELHGITVDDIERLDDNGSAFRRTYFWRNSLRTLIEIREVFNRLNADAGFRDAMASSASTDLRKSFEDAKKALNRAAEDFLYDLRKTVSAHLDYPTMQVGVNTLDFQKEGFAELAREAGRTHFAFATELIWAALLPRSSRETLRTDLEDLLHKSASLMPVMMAIDSVIACYMRDRRLP
jgi:hypothetical protein